MQINEGEVEASMHNLLIAMGIDPTKEPYKDTDKRYARLLTELFGQPKSNIKVFEEECSGGAIELTDHTVWSFCPHHMLPVQMIVDVSYLPLPSIDNKYLVLGLSKVARICTDVIQEGPALQEKVTLDIAKAIKQYADSVTVSIRGWHLCCAMRGVKSTGTMKTSITLTKED